MTPREPRRIAAHRADAGWQPTPRPAVLDRLRAVELDVHDDIARGAEPFARIMDVVRGLGAADTLVLRVPFEPAPLYDVLARRGLLHWTERAGPGDCTVWFYPAHAQDEPAMPDATAPGGSTTIDVRGLEPPLPMVLVLERLEGLGPGETLVVLHERRPMFLYPQIEARGFVHETDDSQPGTVRIVIRRPAI
jgi:TusA-related sulfurtransferase